MILSELIALSERPRSGQWFDAITLNPAPAEANGHDAFEVCVALTTDPAVRHAARKLARELHDAGGLDAEAPNLISLASHVVDWRGLTTESGEPIECSPRRAYELFRNEFPGFADDVKQIVLTHARPEAAPEGN